jgi:glycosyltransferase involved in cell wall biosynthesis
MALSVSILLATFNGINFLREQIDSILLQDYENWLLFISDDGSVDGTMFLIEEYRSRYKDKIFLIDNIRRFGNARDNFFNLLSRISGDLFFFCDQDDYWEKNKLSKLIASYNVLSEIEKKKPILIHSDLMVVDSNMNMLAKSFFTLSNINYQKTNLRNIIVQNIVTGCAMMVNKPLKDMLFSHSKNYEDLYEHIIMHDWYCALVASVFGKIICINQTLVKYRQHSNNSVGAKNVRDIKYLFNRMKKYSIVKKDIVNTQKQANVFLKMYGDELSLSDKKALSVYASINNFSKFYRVFFIIKNSFLKHGLLRIFGQIICI